MSQQQWGQTSGGGSTGGSVRRARQRMEAGLPPEMPQAPQQRRYEPPSQARSPPQNRQRPQMPQALQGQGPIGVAISRPTQVPQWPLAGKIETVRDQNSNDQYQPPAGRGMPPQRPPRPSHVPSMLDASRLQEHTPSFQYMPQHNQIDANQERAPRHPEEDLTSPIIGSPMTPGSRPSTVSSVGTIPDFPIPMPPPLPGVPRRSANLGPPPSGRRGASSYYSQMSYVSPIPEESPRTQHSHVSYASSAAMPTSWGADSPGYEHDDDEEYAKYIRERSQENEAIEEGRESRESNADDSDVRGLIRSASLGKRAKPSMVTTKNAERVELQRPNPQPQQKSTLERMGMIAGVVTGGTSGTALAAAKSREGQRETIWPTVGNPDSPLAGGTGLIDKSTSSSENEVPQVGKGFLTNIAEPVPLNVGATDMLGAYNAASSLQPPGRTPTRTPSPSFSRLSALRRPLRLDIDAVRDAEARGSLTSLPDLIRRATKLAAMMDRGKRPASRLNDLNDFPSDSDLGLDKEMGLLPYGNRQSGLSNMLAAFPPPGLATPTRGDTPRPQSSWPVIDSSGVDGSRGYPRRRRRCCGLPCWGFLLSFLILLLIIAAAVVVPLEFFVFHKANSSAHAVTALQACSKNSATACHNGGTSSLSTGSCSCICINGFTGSTCSVSGASGCTTTTLATDPSYPNVTLGDSIPRIITAAQANFSIPLSGSVILARFNSASLSCVTENALVTFDGQSQRIGTAEEVAHPTNTASSTSTSSPPPAYKIRRDGSSPSSSAAMAAATANGIIYDPSSYQTSSAAAPSGTSSAVASQSSVSPAAEFAVTEEVLDFSRVAVLFVLQEQSLNAAVTAQTELQKFFNQEISTNLAAQNVSMGNGNAANLLNFTIDLGNGSVGSMTRRHLIGQRSIQLWHEHT